MVKGGEDEALANSDWENLLNWPLDEMRPVVLAIFVEVGLYGVHISIFFACFFILCRRSRLFQRILLALSFAMFALATVDVAYTVHAAMKLIGPGLEAKGMTAAALIREIWPKFILFLVNNVIADILLLYRCYMVWNQNPYVLIFPVLLMLASIIVGALGEGSFDSPYHHLIGPYIALIIGMNVLMMALTAGRIWWLARRAAKILGNDATKRYHVAVAIILESGMIYTLSGLAVLITSPLSLYVVCEIIVQAGLGKTFNSRQITTEMVSSGYNHNHGDVGRDREGRTTIMLDTIMDDSIAEEARDGTTPSGRRGSHSRRGLESIVSRPEGTRY